MVAIGLAVASCAPAPSASPPALPPAPLLAGGAAPVDVRALASAAPFTVIVFFSRDCHCLSQHDERLRELFDAYHPRGVQFVLVDPEVTSSPAIDAAEAARRGYPFPLYFDPGARLARALDATYATYTVIVDAQGRPRYRGGIDSDETHLRPDATPYVRNALDDLLAGRAPRTPEAKVLGCSLQTW
jgi:hypothetical protein